MQNSIFSFIIAIVTPATTMLIFIRKG